ncbi:MAG: hypothetical protein MMC33_004318 [Icmadophila ericetorum]|nr:hypothetical protein [Icmadophila ericetorum]
MAASDILWSQQPRNFALLSPAQYRLHLSVLNDSEEHGDCLPRTFIFPSHADLTTANEKINTAFSGPFSEYVMTRCGSETADYMDLSLEHGGRTDNVVIKFDSQTADESWGEFLRRLGEVESGWDVDVAAGLRELGTVKGNLKEDDGGLLV